MSNTTTETPVGLPPCPPWCAWHSDMIHMTGAADAGDPGVEGKFYRNHETASIGPDPYSFVISNEETLYPWPGGVVETSPAYIYLSVENEHLTSEQARDLGQLLASAADRLDEINAGS